MYSVKHKEVLEWALKYLPTDFISYVRSYINKKTRGQSILVTDNSRKLNYPYFNVEYENYSKCNWVSADF